MLEVSFCWKTIFIFCWLLMNGNSVVFVLHLSKIKKLHEHGMEEFLIFFFHFFLIYSLLFRVFLFFHLFAQDVITALAVENDRKLLLPKISAYPMSQQGSLCEKTLPAGRVTAEQSCISPLCWLQGGERDLCAAVSGEEPFCISQIWMIFKA